MTAGKSGFTTIDVDPHFKRVVSYFRPSDYVWWAGATAAFPGAFYFMEAVDPTKTSKRGMTLGLRLCTFLGAFGGFLFAYQRSSLRLWGWSENERELKKAIEEGGDVFNDVNKSSLSPYLQGVAHRNSVHTQLKFSVIPWFNVVQHGYHGTPPKEEETS